MSLLTDALCTVQDVRDFSELENISDDREKIENLINSVTEWFEGFCDVGSFLSTTHLEYYNGGGSSFIYPKNNPITSVLSLADDDNYLWGVDSTYAASDYRIIQNGKGIYLVDDIFTNAVENVKIQYVAGYSEVPYDLKQVCIQEVLRKYNHRKDFDVVRQTIGGNDVEYVNPGMMSETIQVLTKYRNYR